MALRIVVMGVSGSGKTTVGRALAAALQLPFIEGDELHPPRNVALMAAGTPLTDADRQGWLQAVAGRLVAAADTGAVASCSALRRSYRDLLRAGAPGLRFVYLHGDAAVLAARLRARAGHYMPASLLQSQLDTLEPPQADEAAIGVDITAATDPVAGEIVRQLQAAASPISAFPDSGAPRAPSAMTFDKIILGTGADGRAQFRVETLALDEGKPQARLSALMASGGYQLRMSPVGFRSEFHCTETPQWVFILSGRMEIGLQDGSTRVFEPGQHFYSDDRLPASARFDAALHGHRSRQLGDEPLVTLFVRG